MTYSVLEDGRLPVKNRKMGIKDCGKDQQKRIYTCFIKVPDIPDH